MNSIFSELDFSSKLQIAIEIDNVDDDDNAKWPANNLIIERHSNI